MSFKSKNKTDGNYFFAAAPGSTEVYMIPNDKKVEFLKWCQCEFFDEEWRQWRDFFKPFEVTYKYEQ